MTEDVAAWVMTDKNALFLRVYPTVTRSYKLCMFSEPKFSSARHEPIMTKTYGTIDEMIGDIEDMARTPKSLLGGHFGQLLAERMISKLKIKHPGIRDDN